MHRHRMVLNMGGGMVQSIGGAKGGGGGANFSLAVNRLEFLPPISAK